MKTPCPSRVPREPTVHRHVDDHAVDGRSTRVWGPQARNVVFPPRNRHAGTEPSTPRRRMTSKLRMAGRIVIVALGSLLAFCSGAWGALALWYRLPGGRAARVLGSAAWVALLLALATLAIDRHGWLPLGTYAAAYAMLLLWWVGIAPSGQRDWRDDVARLLTGTVQGDHVRLDNVRNFDWRSDIDYDIRWESRSYDLARLVGADAVVSHWGSRAIHHALLSFGFEDGRHLALSASKAPSAAGKYSRSACRNRSTWRVRSQSSVLCARATTLIACALELSAAMDRSWCASVRTKSARMCASAGSLLAPDTPWRSRHRAACSGFTAYTV